MEGIIGNDKSFKGGRDILYEFKAFLMRGILPGQTAAGLIPALLLRKDVPRNDPAASGGAGGRIPYAIK